MRILFYIILILSLHYSLFANNAIDSLENLLSERQGKDRLEILAKLSRAYRAENTSKAVIYGEECLELAVLLGDKDEELKALNNLGITFYHLGYYEITLDYFIRVLEIAEELEHDDEISRVLNNLGNLYDEIGDKGKAIEYYERSMVLKMKIGNKRALANTLNNLGYVYNEIGETEKAYKYFIEVLKIDTAENYVEGVFSTYNNLGLCYLNNWNYDSALYFMNKALALENEIDNLYYKADLYKNLASLEYKNRDNKKALALYHVALQKAEALNARPLLKDCYKGLAEIYSAEENYRLAYENFKKFTLINDSIFNDNNSRRMASLESDYKMQKREKEIHLLKQETEFKNVILEKNKHINYFLYAGLILFVGLIVVLFQKYQFKAQANNLLKIQNDLIAAKNSDITDSIYYARGIQDAILPDLKLLKNNFEEYFIISKPRDIVNGDFYWYADKGEYFVLAVVDCTGHGVPGAFMNVMGNSLLNQIVKEKNIIQPSQILYELNLGVLNTLHQENFDRSNKDGMDVGIILYHKPTGELIFSGAKHSLYFYKNSELEVIKGNIYSIGGNYYQVERRFKENKIKLSKSDTFYLFTDGIIDQFGEKENKKFMGHRLKDLLRSIQSKSMSQQSEIIDSTLSQWKGKLEQTDDILLIGIRI